MNIDTHFDYNNHIVLISTHTKIGTPHEKALVPCKQNKFVDLAFLNEWLLFAFCQRLSLIVQITIQDIFRQGHLVKLAGISKTTHGFVGLRHFTLVGEGWQ